MKGGTGTQARCALRKRAMSNGEDQNRQVRAGATAAEGRDNRRVALVIDYAGAGSICFDVIVCG